MRNEDKIERNEMTMLKTYGFNISAVNFSEESIKTF